MGGAGLGPPGDYDVKVRELDITTDSTICELTRAIVKCVTEMDTITIPKINPGETITVIASESDVTVTGYGVIPEGESVTFPVANIDQGESTICETCGAMKREREYNGEQRLACPFCSVIVNVGPMKGNSNEG
ncbi:MAG: hypothetical protein ACR2RE_13160 [Geminicoccaceae bacterium]